MGRSLNKVMLIGRVGKDPEYKQFPWNKNRATFSLATNETWLQRDGQRTAKTEWHSIVAWGHLAGVVSEFVKKGMLVYIEGKLNTRSWEGRDGQKMRCTQVVMSGLTFLDSSRPTEARRDEGGAQADDPQAETGGDGEAQQEEIPF